MCDWHFQNRFSSDTPGSYQILNAQNLENLHIWQKLKWIFWLKWRGRVQTLQGRLFQFFEIEQFSNNFALNNRNFFIVALKTTYWAQEFIVHNQKTKPEWMRKIRWLPRFLPKVIGRYKYTNLLYGIYATVSAAFGFKMGHFCIQVPKCANTKRKISRQRFCWYGQLCCWSQKFSRNIFSQFFIFETFKPFFVKPPTDRVSNLSPKFLVTKRQNWRFWRCDWLAMG